MRTLRGRYRSLATLSKERIPLSPQEIRDENPRVRYRSLATLSKERIPLSPQEVKEEIEE